MILALFFLISSAKADWVPTQCNAPILGKAHLFVATYLHRGAIDYGIGTEYEFYLTVVYDFLRSPMIVYAATTSKNLSDLQAQHEAEQWLIRVESERIRNVTNRLYIDATFSGDEDLDSPTP
jgi:hypothetical protein